MKLLRFHEWEEVLINGLYLDSLDVIHSCCLMKLLMFICLSLGLSLSLTSRALQTESSLMISSLYSVPHCRSVDIPYLHYTMHRVHHLTLFPRGGSLTVLIAFIIPGCFVLQFVARVKQHMTDHMLWNRFSLQFDSEASVSNND